MTTHPTPETLRALLASSPPQAAVPELVEAARDPRAARARPGWALVERSIADLRRDVEAIPRLTYTLYRDVQRLDRRSLYEVPYFQKRAKMGVAAFGVLMGEDRYLPTLQDYLWSTCEESTWVLPQVEHLGIELRSVATAMDLAEIVTALGDRIEPAVVARVRREVEARVLGPFLADPDRYFWHHGTNNWNGVCNGAIGCAFLLLEEDPDRLAGAVARVLDGLDTFLETAFAADGASEEGVAYWHYGLGNVIALAEMLRRRTGGALHLLASERMRRIAAYPARVMLSPGRYLSYSDSHEESAFHPGLVQRLVEATGARELLTVLAEPAALRVGHASFGALWRALLWWDGARPEAAEIEDAVLPSAEVVRLTARTAGGAPVVLAAKAGPNAVSHNHNDAGTFVLHVDGETLLCDPGSGKYSVRYFSEHRYENPFANSYGHSVPRIGGALQSEGDAYRGVLLGHGAEDGAKRVEMDLQGAYAVPGLGRLRRILRLAPRGEVALEDTFAVTGGALEVEEALVTFCAARLDGRTARIEGERHALEIAIEAPAAATWSLEVLEEASRANDKERPLRRLTFSFEAGPGEAVARVRGRIVPLCTTNRG
jgi:hypothetical protein